MGLTFMHYKYSISNQQQIPADTAKTPQKANPFTSLPFLLCPLFLFRIFSVQVYLMICTCSQTPKNIVELQVLMKHQRLEGVKFKTYNFLKVLGQGAWATVYQAVDERDDSQIAVKVIPKQLMIETPKLEELVQTEIRVLKECKNQNVIRYVDNFKSEKSVIIVMEYCNGGDLEKYLEKKHRLTEDEATTFLKQIINGFKGLHEVNAMHRDFKVANVLLHQGICKIADLGFAKQMEKNVTKTILGTSLTMAPEVLDEKPYGFQADIWSLGVVFYQLLYGKYPYAGISDMDILKKIKSSRPDYSGVNISDKARDFIDRCLTINPKSRISWKEIYDHPLIKEAEKIIYGLTSKLRVNDNRNFYERDVKIDQNLIYAQRNAYKKKQLEPIEVVKQQKPVDLQKLMKQNEEKKRIAIATEKYQKQYLNKRNNIMFIFKYVTPYIYSFFNINANHGITLFVISKKAYHDMKKFLAYITSKTNFLKLDPYFKEFTANPKYREIQDIIKGDLQLITAQIFTYKEDIEYCSAEVKREFDIEKIYHSNWQAFVKETINGYEFQLSEGIDRLKGSEKRDLIKVIQALIYFKEHSDADIEEFDKKIESIDFGKAESKIQDRLQSLLKWE